MSFLKLVAAFVLAWVPFYFVTCGIGAFVRWDLGIYDLSTWEEVSRLCFVFLGFLWAGYITFERQAYRG